MSKWIPVTDRLPQKNGFYLVSVGAEYKAVRVYEYKPCEGCENENLWKGNDGCYCFNWFVKAWMPLPKHWEGEQMSVSLWAYSEQCDGDFCCGDCDQCNKADAVQVVRCKDCKWWKSIFSWNGNEHKVCVKEPTEPTRKADFFCADGERE